MIMLGQRLLPFAASLSFSGALALASVTACDSEAHSKGEPVKTLSAGSSAAAGTSSGKAGASGSAGSSAQHAAANLKDCNWDQEPTDGCGTFTTQGGVKIELGSYGAALDQNMGKGFEVPVNSRDTDDTCTGFVASFGEDPSKSVGLLDTTNLDFALYSVYRPANWVDGEKYPIITWGNGTCAKPEGYGALLRYVASHGFFVIAANSRWVGGNGAMTKALDYAFAANDDEQSPYYHRLDTSKVGAMGHSQGGMATITAASDARINAVIIWNGGATAVKPFLAVSGDMDIGNPVASKLADALTGDPPGAYMFFHMVIGDGPARGHLTLMTQPERVVEPATAWFKYRLQGDETSRSFFVGDDCKLCNKADEFEYGEKGLDSN
jgi:hypothetical protein